MLRRVLLRGVTAATVAAGAVFGAAGPAGAHASILGTEPQYGASLATPPDRVLIRYDLPVEVKGAQVALARSGKTVPVGRPQLSSSDRKEVALPLPKLSPGGYVLTWFLFGSDGDVMGGELAFTVSPAGGPAALGVGPSLTELPATQVTPVSFAPLSRAQDTARLAAMASLAILVGGVAFVAALWWAGALIARLRLILWASLAGALLANAAALGLKGAAVQGRSALWALSPSSLTALNGTHVGKVLLARLGFLLVAIPVVAVLTRAPERALNSDLWYISAAGCGLGALVTHGWLSHAYRQGLLASAAHVAHFAAIAVWLGGLVILAAVVLPRRRAEELAELVPRYSRLAFGSVVTAVVAGTALLILISPRWSGLPGSEYGKLLLVKLALVAGLLFVASRARRFVRHDLLIHTASTGPAGVELERRLEVSGGSGVATLVAPETAPPLQPFITAVLAELCIAASILTATALLLGRAPPS